MEVVLISTFFFGRTSLTGGVSVTVSPLPCSGVMICSKCLLIIPGRRYTSTIVTEEPINIVGTNIGVLQYVSRSFQSQHRRNKHRCFTICIAQLSKVESIKPLNRSVELTADALVVNSFSINIMIRCHNHRSLPGGLLILIVVLLKYVTLALLILEFESRRGGDCECIRAKKRNK